EDVPAISAGHGRAGLRPAGLATAGRTEPGIRTSVRNPLGNGGGDHPVTGSKRKPRSLLRTIESRTDCVQNSLDEDSGMTKSNGSLIRSIRNANLEIDIILAELGKVWYSACSLSKQSRGSRQRGRKKSSSLILAGRRSKPRNASRPIASTARTEISGNVP